MDLRPDRILRRDFPRSDDGYDRAAVDAHLAAVAAAVEHGRSAGVGGSPGSVEAERELRAGGRALLEEISAMRLELKRVSVALRQHEAAIAEALDELDAPTDEPQGAEPGEAPDVGAAAEPEAAEPEAAAPEAAGPEAAGPESADPDAAGPEAADARDRRATVRADARLVALDLALGGSGRGEIERELAARFDLTDPATLVDEVLAAIG